MPYFQWNDSLLTGIKTIDDQHRQLVDMVNALHDSVEEVGQHCPAPDLVARLKAYAAEHFHVEEGYMQAFAYPEYEAHLKEHQTFVDAVQTFEDNCASDSANAPEVLDFVKKWLPSTSPAWTWPWAGFSKTTWAEDGPKTAGKRRARPQPASCFCATRATG